MNLYEEIEKIKSSGYSEQNAQSKLGQDIVPLKILIWILSGIPYLMIPSANLWKSLTASMG